jgi:hypothetical protein
LVYSPHSKSAIKVDVKVWPVEDHGKKGSRSTAVPTDSKYDEAQKVSWYGFKRRMLSLLSVPEDNMDEVPIQSLKPGTVLSVRSLRIPAVMHWGVVGYGRDTQGYPRVWHSQKSDTLRCTNFEEFSAGQGCEILWVPENAQQAHRVIERLRSKEGLRWHLTQANCEMVVRWAVEGRAVSHQLGFGTLAVLGIVVVAIAASSD